MEMKFFEKFDLVPGINQDYWIIPYIECLDIFGFQTNLLQCPRHFVAIFRWSHRAETNTIIFIRIFIDQDSICIRLVADSFYIHPLSYMCTQNWPTCLFPQVISTLGASRKWRDFSRKLYCLFFFKIKNELNIRTYSFWSEDLVLFSLIKR